MLYAGLALVFLATIGAVGGYLLAGDSENGAPTAARSPEPAPASTSRMPTPSAARTTIPAPARTTASGGIVLPDLVGEDFEEARDELRERKLGWQLIFGSGEDRAVSRTDPAPGAAVRRGTTIKVYVTGAAPLEEVPDVVGESCGEAANEIVDEGFFPDYRTGRTGQVVRQDPSAKSEARWNDRIAIFCGNSPPTSPNPLPTP